MTLTFFYHIFSGTKEPEICFFSTMKWTVSVEKKQFSRFIGSRKKYGKKLFFCCKMKLLFFYNFFSGTKEPEICFFSTMKWSMLVEKKQFSRFIGSRKKYGKKLFFCCKMKLLFFIIFFLEPKNRKFVFFRPWSDVCWSKKNNFPFHWFQKKIWKKMVFFDHEVKYVESSVWISSATAMVENKLACPLRVRKSSSWRLYSRTYYTLPSWGKCVRGQSIRVNLHRFSSLYAEGGGALIDFSRAFLRGELR